MNKKAIPIYFHSENISFVLKQKTLTRVWLLNTIKKENKQLGEVNYIFCDDQHLLHINQTYLKHNTLTDIVTFDYSEKNILSGDIFISIERVKENAKKFNVSFESELRRVMVHGLLHLAGYKDKTKEHKTIMTRKEDHCLALFDVK